ncbi:MAG TPA: peptidylprolyl isomerase [Gemmatimonadales bacterium]|nr:peptidylprolyl isomerase [Gemmatimonadales bacterium]
MKEVPINVTTAQSGNGVGAAPRQAVPHRRWAVAAPLALGLVACGPLRDAARAHVETAARVNEQDLPVDQLAEWFVTSRSLPVRQDVVERVAHLWVDFVLFGQRVAAGDSLTDSQRVLAARWPEARRLVVARFHDGLVAQRVRLDSAAVDSVYHAGEWRYVRHVLLRVTPAMTPEQVEAKRRQAAALRARLAAGGPWSQANAVNEDTLARAAGGALGVLGRGEIVPAFEQAAYALAPGELSPVTESPFGLHVIERPRLAEVRAPFRDGVMSRLVARFDSAFVLDLERTRGLRVKGTGPGMLRRAVSSPELFRLSRHTMAAFDGGRVTAGDVLQWLDVLPPQVTEEISTASEDELRRFLRSVARDAMLSAEAAGAGVGLDSAEYRRLRDGVAVEVAAVRTALGLDSAGAADGAAVRSRVDGFLNQMVNDPEKLVPVPRFLADQLRQEARVRVFPAGVTRAFALATARRTALDSAAGRIPATPGSGLR